MYKFVALFALLACAVAAPAPEPQPGLVELPSALHAAPVVASPVVVAHSVPVATSYSNTYKITAKSPIFGTVPYVAAPYAAVGHTIVKPAAPIVAAAHTVYAHAPVVAGATYTY